MSEIAALGYLGLEVSSLADWRQFAEEVVGLKASESDDGTIELRMDSYAMRLRLREGPSDDLDYCGWEVRDVVALDRLAARLLAAGIAVSTGDPALALYRRVAGLIRFADPEGNLHEAFYGPLQRTDVPFVSPLGTQFKTGSQGLGHIVLRCDDLASMTEFFVDLLGFKISDHIRTEIVPGRPVDLTFLRCNGRHHSLALAPVPTRKKIVHLMVEACKIDDVGRALDRCMARGIHLSFTLGRHSNDDMLSFYPMTPSGFDLEYGWGGLEIDDRRWHVVTHATNSAWGHVYQRPPRAVPKVEGV